MWGAETSGDDTYDIHKIVLLLQANEPFLGEYYFFLILTNISQYMLQFCMFVFEISMFIFEDPF